MKVGGSIEEAALAYKGIALKTHPALGQAGSGELFCKAAEAYVVLHKHSAVGAGVVRDAPLIDPHEVFNVVLDYSWRLPGAEGCSAAPRNVLGLNVALKKTLRTASLYEFHKGLSSEGLRELSVLLESSRGDGEVTATSESASPPDVQQKVDPAEGVEVVMIRHGMGHHNDLMGACSGLNRDSELNPTGVLQAQRLGCVLRSVGGYDANTLVIVSPFRRALQTAAEVLGDDARSMKTIVAPLAAEHTLYRSAVQKGDRGSTAVHLGTLFPPHLYPQFDFSTIETYCTERHITKGQWWHHAPPPSIGETYSSFRRRAEEFRAWLGRTANESGARRVLVFSHGGLLTASFGRPNYGNCGMRVFTVFRDGSARRGSTGEALAAPAVGTLAGVCRADSWVEIDDTVLGRQLWVEGVRRCSQQIEGHWVFRVQGVLDDDEEVVALLRLSELRRLHDDVKSALGTASYKEYDLNALFPAIHWRHGIAAGAEMWLQQLCVVMGDIAFPQGTRDLVYQVLALKDSEASDEENPVSRPLWVPDMDSNQCAVCKTRFNVVRRRHHCRLCGELVCSKCSPHRLKFRDATTGPQRVCTPCNDIVVVTAGFPQTLHIESKAQPDAAGVYRKALWHVNSMPFYASAGKPAWYVFFAVGSWWVSSSQQDFRKGGGVLCGVGPSPDVVPGWSSAPQRATRSKDCPVPDPDRNTTVVALHENGEAGDDDWWDVASAYSSIEGGKEERGRMEQEGVA